MCWSRTSQPCLAACSLHFLIWSAILVGLWRSLENRAYTAQRSWLTTPPRLKTLPLCPLRQTVPHRLGSRQVDSCPGTRPSIPAPAPARSHHRASASTPGLGSRVVLRTPSRVSLAGLHLNWKLGGASGRRALGSRVARERHCARNSRLPCSPRYPAAVPHQRACRRRAIAHSRSPHLRPDSSRRTHSAWHGRRP